MSAKTTENRARELAILSRDAYIAKDSFKNNDIKDYSFEQSQNIIKYTYNVSNGFQAKAYKNNDTGEIVIAFAGTDKFSLKDLATDASLASGVKPPQVDEAISFYKQVKEEFCKNDPNSKITLTGHSLGGMLAIQVALYDYTEQMHFMGGVTKENFLNMKTQVQLPEVVAFEAPSIIMSSEYNNQIYDEYKDILGLFGYTCSITADAPGLMSPLAYQPSMIV